MLKSQKMRKRAPEQDSLRIGSGWKLCDLEKPQIIIESTFGDSHPGSCHLDDLVNQVKVGVESAGGFGARYYCTDICDGESQGTDGMNYSLASRECIANMIEIHASATPYDGGVFIASCDKGLPGNLMGLARVDIPSIVVPGGTMRAGKDMITLEQIGIYNAMFKRGEITESEFLKAKRSACPNCGACSFLGTASTMQIMSEALGLALPGSALLPSESDLIKPLAREAGVRAVKLATKTRLTPGKILTEKSFENAIYVHAAISGSTNALLHLPAIAHELDIEITAETFNKIHEHMHSILDIRPVGRWPAECVHYAGGVPAIMEEIKEHLYLEEMTVTGRCLGENLEELKQADYYDRCNEGLDEFNKRYNLHLRREDIIRHYNNPLSKNGSITILTGNLAPEGAVIKHIACPEEMHHAILRARTFDNEEKCLDAVLNHEVNKGDAVFIRYEGPKGSGMPEMFYTSEAISSDPELGKSIALITDGRFSGASTGPVVGHCSPEAAEGGPIALVEDNDLIEINVKTKHLDIVGINGERKEFEEIEKILEQRRKKWGMPEEKFARGVLRLFSKYAVSPMKGAYLDY